MHKNAPGRQDQSSPCIDKASPSPSTCQLQSCLTACAICLHIALLTTSSSRAACYGLSRVGKQLWHYEHQEHCNQTYTKHRRYLTPFQKHASPPQSCQHCLSGSASESASRVAKDAMLTSHVQERVNACERSNASGTCTMHTGPLSSSLLFSTLPPCWHVPAES